LAPIPTLISSLTFQDNKKVQDPEFSVFPLDPKKLKSSTQAFVNTVEKMSLVHDFTLSPPIEDKVLTCDVIQTSVEAT